MASVHARLVSVASRMPQNVRLLRYFLQPGAAGRATAGTRRWSVSLVLALSNGVMLGGVLLRVRYTTSHHRRHSNQENHEAVDNG